MSAPTHPPCTLFSCPRSGQEAQACTTEDPPSSASPEKTEILQKISAKNFPQFFRELGREIQPYQVEVLRELMEIAEKNFPKPLVLFSTSRREGHFYRMWREQNPEFALFFCGVDHAIPESERIVQTKGRVRGDTIVVDEIAVVAPKIEPRKLVFAHDVLVLGTQAGKTMRAEEELARLEEEIAKKAQVYAEIPAEEPDDIPFWKKIRGKNSQKKFGRYAPGRNGR